MAGKPREVCRFYLQGKCSFGNKCFNIHPPRDQLGYGGQGIYISNSLSIKSVVYLSVVTHRYII